MHSYFRVSKQLPPRNRCRGGAAERRAAARDSLDSPHGKAYCPGESDPIPDSPGGDMPQATSTGKPSSLVDTRVIYCGDNLEQLSKLPDACVDLIHFDPPFNPNRNYEVFWGETLLTRLAASSSKPTKPSSPSRSRRLWRSRLR